MLRGFAEAGSVQERETQKGKQKKQQQMKKGLIEQVCHFGPRLQFLSLRSESEYTVKETIGNKKYRQENSGTDLFWRR